MIVYRYCLPERDSGHTKAQPKPDNLVLNPNRASTSYLTLDKMYWGESLDEALAQI